MHLLSCLSWILLFLSSCVLPYLICHRHLSYPVFILSPLISCRLSILVVCYISSSLISCLLYLVISHILSIISRHLSYLVACCQILLSVISRHLISCLSYLAVFHFLSSVISHCLLHLAACHILSSSDNLLTLPCDSSITLAPSTSMTWSPGNIPPRSAGPLGDTHFTNWPWREREIWHVTGKARSGWSWCCKSVSQHYNFTTPRSLAVGGGAPHLQSLVGVHVEAVALRPSVQGDQPQPLDSSSPASWHDWSLIGGLQ